MGVSIFKFGPLLHRGRDDSAESCAIPGSGSYGNTHFSFDIACFPVYRTHMLGRRVALPDSLYLPSLKQQYKSRSQLKAKSQSIGAVASLNDCELGVLHEFWQARGVREHEQRARLISYGCTGEYDDNFQWSIQGDIT